MTAAGLLFLLLVVPGADAEIGKNYRSFNRYRPMNSYTPFHLRSTGRRGHEVNGLIDNRTLDDEDEARRSRSGEPAEPLSKDEQDLQLVIKAVEDWQQLEKANKVVDYRKKRKRDDALADARTNIATAMQNHIHRNSSGGNFNLTDDKSGKLRRLRLKNIDSSSTQPVDSSGLYRATALFTEGKKQVALSFVVDLASPYWEVLAIEPLAK
jgi:hypothetical protein